MSKNEKQVVVESETTGLLSKQQRQQSDEEEEDDDEESEYDKKAVTYIELLLYNTNYRYYWLSYVANHMGEWMTYLASLSMIQQHQATATATFNNSSSSNNNNNTLISVLILVKLLPNVLFMPLGGVLADKYDRRQVQIILDVASSVLVFVYILAVLQDSIPILYVANFIQESLSGLYVPSNSAMIPLLANRSQQELQKATTLSGLTWSLMAAVGSSTGGLFVALFGIVGCFVIDSLTYVTSALLLQYGVHGSYLASEEEEKQQRKQQQQQQQQRRSLSSSISMTTTTAVIAKTSMTGGSGNGGPDNLFLAIENADSDEDQSTLADVEADDGQLPIMANALPSSSSAPPKNTTFMYGLQFAFVECPLLGAYALLKCAAGLAYGPCDVLNVVFSSRNSESDPQRTSLKLGILFGCVGIGCIIGSTLCDVLVTLSRPLRIVRLCLVGYCLISLGAVLMGMFPDRFECICVSGVIRSIGSSLIWINSTLLLQKYTPPALLGRVRSIDVAGALFGEAFSALGGGLLMDRNGTSPEYLSMMISVVAMGCFVLWLPVVGFRTPKLYGSAKNNIVGQ
jgi:MFS family permease